MLENIPEVCTDTRENRPVKFPKTVLLYDDYGLPSLVPVNTQSVKLSTGDYALKGYEKYILIERKYSPGELWKNLFSEDRHRFRRCIDRLISETEFPVLYLDFPVCEFYTVSQYCPEPQKVLDKMLRTVFENRLHLVWRPTPNTQDGAYKSGEFLVHLMWAAVCTAMKMPPKPKPIVPEHPASVFGPITGEKK